MFSNKVVLITGASAGIGAATAECFAKEGASLAIVGRNETKLNNVAQCCEKLGAEVYIIKADIAEDDEAKAIIQQTIRKYGKLDVVINNAGIYKPTDIESNMVEIYDETMKTNLRAVVLITSLAIPYLKLTKGNVINVSSVDSMNVKYPGLTAYGISKAGIDYFTKSLAKELGPSGVRVNSVNPGPVYTKMLEGSESEFIDLTVLGRMSEAAEIGDLMLFIASDKAKSITGSCYVIDNGYLL